MEHKFSPFTRNDIEITGEELSGAPPPLHVRRGSEPALNRLSPIPPVSVPADPTKRWSAAPIIEDQNSPHSSSTPMKTIVSIGRGTLHFLIDYLCIYLFMHLFIHLFIENMEGFIMDLMCVENEEYSLHKCCIGLCCRNGVLCTFPLF